MRKVLAKLGLILFGLLIALIISEISLRIILSLPVRTNGYNIYWRHPVIGHMLLPNKEYYAFNDLLEFKTKIKINSWGLRDDDIDFLKKDKRVVLALGDSFTYAHEVESEKTFVEILQRRLSSFLKQDKEVINAGVRYYGTAQELLFYKELISRGLKTDLVLLWFSINDILDNQCLDYYMRKRGGLPCFQIVGNDLKLELPEFSHKSAGSKAAVRKVSVSNASVKKKWAEFFKDSHLYRVLYLKLFHFSMNHPGIISFVDSLGFHIDVPRIPTIISGWYTDQSFYGWRLTEKLIENLNKQVEKNGGRLALVLIPHSLQYSQKKQKLLKTTINDPLVEKFLNDSKKPQRLVTTFCQKNKIPVIDLLPGFEHAYNDKASPFFFPYDGHLNPEGHLLSSDLVYKQIMENKMILDVLKGESNK